MLLCKYVYTYFLQNSMINLAVEIDVILNQLLHSHEKFSNMTFVEASKIDKFNSCIIIQVKLLYGFGY